MSGIFFGRGCSPVFLGEVFMAERRRRKEWNGIERPDGARIRWSAGEGERSLLLVPGFGGDGDCWGTAFPRQLSARGIAPVVFDPRGLGESALGSGMPSIALFADDATAVAEAAGAPLAVLGWSMGAAVAAELALARPDLVSELVLCCGSADHRRVAGERPDLFRHSRQNALFRNGRGSHGGHAARLRKMEHRDRKAFWEILGPPLPPMVKGSGGSRPPWRNARPWWAGLVRSPCPSWWWKARRTG